MTLASHDALADAMQASLRVAPTPEATDCADAGALSAAANRALQRSAFSPGDGAESPSQFEIEYSRSESGYVASVRERGLQTALRTLESGEPLCGPLTTALGVTLAMMLDSAHAATRKPEPASPDGEPPPAEAPARPSAKRTACDSVFLEGLGNGIYDSINYERLFWDGQVSVRVGFGFIRGEAEPFSSPAVPGLGGVRSYWFSDFTLPILVNYYWGTASHKLQIGIGATGVYRTATGPAVGWFFDHLFSFAPGYNIAGTAVVAYRYLPYRGGPSFGAGFTPLLGPGGFMPSVSLNVGADF
ncbi:MAG: hypothetical protein FWD17_02785 [Polyangiaceae bacterium]|nr:hypothetical protein [Polyangiaceae bacterium]